MCPVHGRMEAVDKQSCLLHVGAETPRMLAYMLTLLDVDFTVESPAGLRRVPAHSGIVATSEQQPPQPDRPAQPPQRDSRASRMLVAAGLMASQAVPAGQSPCRTAVRTDGREWQRRRSLGASVYPSRM